MNRRALYAVAGLLIFAAIVAPALASHVYADRGRDETFYLSVHELPVQPGGMVTQPIPLQRSDPAAVELPYRWLGAQPALVDVRLSNADGSVVSERQELFPNSRGSKVLQPTGNGSVWQDLQAAFKAVTLPSGLAGEVTLSLTRVDQLNGTFVLFASDAASAAAGVDVGTQPDKRPPIAGRPTEVLDLETEYGSMSPALAKVPTYVSRIASIAPPWIPAPIFILLFVGAVLVTFFLYAFVVMTPETKPESGGPDLVE